MKLCHIDQREISCMFLWSLRFLASLRNDIASVTKIWVLLQLTNSDTISFRNSSFIIMERATGLEPATSSLGSWHSTTELRPLMAGDFYSTCFFCQGVSRRSEQENLRETRLRDHPLSRRGKDDPHWKASAVLQIKPFFDAACSRSGIQDSETPIYPSLH